jgi:hypothetical protein
MMTSMFSTKTHWKRSLSRTFIPLLMFLAAGSARADILDFSYLLYSGGPELAGTITGFLLPDHNLFLVTGVGPVTFNGNPAPALPFVYSFDAVQGLDNNPPAVSVDGSYMDLLACSAAGCPDGFGFAVADATAAKFVPLYDGEVSFGGTVLPFIAANWTASVSMVPEASSLFLGLTMLALVLVVHRQRRRSRTMST